MDIHELGTAGEDEVARILEAEGYEILGRNVNFPGKGELDIVARKGGLVLIVEVKATFGSGDPELQLGPQKIKSLRSAVKVYLAQNPDFMDLEVRFDIFLLWLRGKQWEVVRHEGVWI